MAPQVPEQELLLLVYWTEGSCTSVEVQDFYTGLGVFKRGTFRGCPCRMTRWRSPAKVFELDRQRGQSINRNKREGELDQFVLNSVAGGGTARGNPDLAVDRGQVPVDRATTDDQLLGYLGVGQSLGHQAQHLHLAGCQ